ncbi:centrosomal protein of 192 kDa-like isoform X4 [Ostrea edulis]|uniref:centrosomal protein of 192 kDa-like isoform X4 n=1 Tax=Ostrea edulis TaxID=37623 RepID=UPI0024AEC62D|nr:centrosomal protein of 192 kDa-like isoform X4 [Ostrea edulis]
MSGMDLRESLDFKEDSTIAQYGLRESIENASFFKSREPLAASTVSRPHRPNNLNRQDQGRLQENGSFLEDFSTPRRGQDVEYDRFGVESSMGISRGPSRDSSLGLIPVEAMSDLSASVLQVSEEKFFNSEAATVKKRPSSPKTRDQLGDFKQALFPTVSAGQMPGILSEEEGDVTIPDIQFQEGELEQLDEEFDLEMTANESALEYAGKPNPDDSEIKVHTMSDYTTGDDIWNSVYLKSGSTFSQFVTAEEADSSNAQETSNVQDTTRNSERRYPSLSKVTLFDDLGSCEDVSQPLSARTRAQYPNLAAVGMDSELFDQSVEVHKSISKRGSGAGQSADLEVNTSKREVEAINGSNDDMSMRYSAEGDVNSLDRIAAKRSPQNDSDSDEEDTTPVQSQSSPAKEFLNIFKESFKSPTLKSGNLGVEPEEQRVKPMGDDLLTEKGPNRYQDPQPSYSDASLIPSGQRLDTTDDIFGETVNPETLEAFVSPGDRLEASGCNINDVQTIDNPFGDLESSFGSFGLSKESPASEQQGNTNQWMQLNTSPLSTRTWNSSQSQASQRLSSQSGVSLRISQESIPCLHQETQLLRDMEGSEYSKQPRRSPEPDDCVFTEPRLSQYYGGDMNTVRRSFPEVFLSQPIKALHSPRLSKSQDPPLVYKDADGEVVTDLAFQTDFTDMVPNQHARLQEQFAKGSLDFDVTMADSEFKSADVAKAMLDEDEEQFEKENVFREDAKIVTPVGSPDSWGYSSKMSISCPSFLKSESNGDDLRISIGTFMKSRSGALGSLGGDGSQERPEFGMKIKTPPQNRKPMALIETEREYESESSPHASKCRTAGVGNEDEDRTLLDDAVTLADLEESPAYRESRDSHPHPPGSKRDSQPQPPGSKPPVVHLSAELSKLQESLRDSDDSLSVTLLHSLLQSVPKDTKPEELSKMVMALSQKSSRSIRHPVNKATKLPIRRGSDVIHKVKGSSPRKTSQDSPEQDKSQHSTSLSSKGSDDQRDDPELKNILHKTRPDGEESDVSLSPINRSDNVTPSDVMLKTPCQSENVEAIERECVIANYQVDRRNQQSNVSQASSIHSNQGSRGSMTSPVSRGGSQRSSQENIRQPLNASVNSSEYRERSRHSSANSNKESRENRIRSPHGSGSANGDLTGHHIPDGTDYSLKADYPHQINMGLSREDLVGTEDIQTADSRGFNFIAKDVEHAIDSKYQRDSEHRGMERNQSDFRCRSDHDIDYSGRQQSVDESERNRNFAVSKKYEVLDEGEYSQSAHNKENISNVQKTLEDRALMPPPPVPSFHHNLVPHHKASDPPMLLTKQSLLKSSFAQHYLPPPATRKILSSKQFSQSHGDIFTLKQDHLPIEDNAVSKTLSQSQSNIEDVSLADLSQHSLITPDQSRHRRILSEPMTDGKRLADDASMFRQPPAFHSTPFQRDATNMSETQFYELNHSVMSVMDGETSTLDPDFKSAKPSMPEYTGVAAIKAPEILSFRDVCCVGISVKTTLPLTNPTHRWLECILQIRQLYVDGQTVGNSTTVPFEMKQKVIVEPNTVEKIEVIFIPKLAGAYVAELLIHSHRFTQDRASGSTSYPTVVTIQAIAEKPKIEVHGFGLENRMLNFGQVTWGSCKSLTLGIVNYGQASLPLRLSISCTKNLGVNNIPWHCFSFDRNGQNSTLGDISVISRSSRPQSPALGKTVVTLCIPGRSGKDSGISEQEVRVWCRPPDKRIDRALAQNPPDEMTARIDIDVDTPTANIPPLRTIDLQAIVGVARLHIPKYLEMVKLESTVRQAARDSIALKNYGNIELKVSLSIPDYDDVFRVRPKQIIIPPGQESEVVVEFFPLESGKKSLESVLLMNVEPDGPLYELPVLGSVVTESMKRQSTNIVLSDRCFIYFGGVGVGKSLEKKFRLKNQAQYPLKLKLEVRDKSHVFKLRTSAIQSNSLTEIRDVIVQPLETFPIYVMYSPLSTALSSGKIIIKPYDTADKFSIPVSGYGGVGKLVVEGASIADMNRYCLDMGDISLGQETGEKIIVRNVGSRPVFVKLMAYTGSHCRKDNVSSRVLVEPSEFILEQEGTKSVIIVLNPSDRETSLCTNSRQIISTVVAFYGDEISRQRFRGVMSSTTKPYKPSSSVDPLILSLNLNHNIPDENLVPEFTVPSEVTTNSMIDTFYTTMSRLYIALVGSPSEFSLTKTPQIHHSGKSPINTEKNWRTSASLTGIPSKDPNRCISPRSSTTPLQNSPLFVPEEEDKDWTVKPTQLIFRVSSKQDEKLPILKFQISNFQSRTLSYDLSWPGQKLKLTPEGGVVGPKDKVTVCISPSPTVYKLINELPWSGCVHVTCGQKTKKVQVQIRTDIEDSQPALPQTLVPVFRHSVGPTISLPYETSVGSMMQASAHKIEFPVTNVGEQSETTFELTNTSDKPMQWIVSSFAPPYVKGADSTKDVFRVMYKVFDFTIKSGSLPPGKSTQVNVEFMPRSKGTFTQHWDVQGTKDRPVRLQLTGESVSTDDLPGSQPSTYREDTTESFQESAHKTHKKSKEDRLVILKNKDLRFLPCSVGQSQIAKLQIANNCSSPQPIEVIPPQPPFYVKHMRFEVKSKKYLMLPVEFRPSEPSNYEGLIVLKTGMGYTLSGKLHGFCTS